MGIRHVLLLHCFVIICGGGAVFSVEGTTFGLKNSAPDTIITNDGLNTSTNDDIVPETDPNENDVPIIETDSKVEAESYNKDTDFEEAINSKDIDLKSENDSDDIDATGKRDESTTKSREDVKIMNDISEWNPVEISRYNTNPTINNQTSTSSISEQQRHALVNKKGDRKNNKVSPENRQDSNFEIDRNEDTRHNKKKRAHSNSGAPSVQLIIIVVGAAVACVIITGFIRWRVRRRINDKKLKKMSESFTAYRGSSGSTKKGTMDTIYECACEEGLDISHAHGRDSLEYSDDTLNKLGEIACSHRFDKPSSLTCSSHSVIDSSGHLHQSGFSTPELDFGFDSGGRKHKSYHKHHVHKSKHSSHHRRKIHDKTQILGKSAHLTDSNNSNNSIKWLLEQGDSKDNEVTTIEHQTSVASSLQPSPQLSRGGLGSLFESWRSLSFNRDWVGRMWQEKHNVRRISDVLRGLTTTSDPDIEDNSTEKHSNDDDSTDKKLAHMQNADDNNCQNTAFNPDDQTINGIPEVSLLSDAQVSENLQERKVLWENSCIEVETDRSIPNGNCYLEITSNVRIADEDPGQVSRAGMLNSFLSFSDQSDEPPEYESLLDSGSFSMNSFTRNIIEHPRRHHRHHRRKRSEHAERNIRPIFSRVHGDETIQTDLSGSLLTHEQEELLPLTRHRSHDMSSVESHTAFLTTPNSQSDQGQNMCFNNLANPSTNNSVPTVATPFVQQEGIVIEQLSDGAKIIYLPPPSLPSYHNDTPPPYQQ